VYNNKQMNDLIVKSIALFIVGCLNVLIGLIILLKNKNSIQNRAFFLCTVAVGIWSFALSGFMIAANVSAAHFFINIVVISLVSIPATFLNFTITLSYKIIDRIKKILLLGNHVMIGVAVVLVFTAPKFFTKEIFLRGWENESIINMGYYIFSIIFLMLTLCFFYMLSLSLRSKELTCQEKHINHCLFCGLILTFIVGSIFNWLLPLLLCDKYIWAGPYASFFFFGFCAYIITRHRFMDARIAINRIAAYLILVFIYGLTGVVFSSFFSYFFTFGLNLPTSLFLTILLVAAGIAFHPLRLHLQTTPDRFLFKKKYEYEQAVKELGEKCGAVVEAGALTNLFSQKIKEMTKTSNLKIYFVD